MIENVFSLLVCFKLIFFLTQKASPKRRDTLSQNKWKEIWNKWKIFFLEDKIPFNKKLWAFHATMLLFNLNNKRLFHGKNCFVINSKLNECFWNFYGAFDIARHKFFFSRLNRVLKREIPLATQEIVAFVSWLLWEKALLSTAHVAMSLRLELYENLSHEQISETLTFQKMISCTKSFIWLPLFEISGLRKTRAWIKSIFGGHWKVF